MSVKVSLQEMNLPTKKDHSFSPFFVCIHKNSIILDIDEGGSQLLGFKNRGDLIGKSIFSFIYGNEQETVTARIHALHQGTSLTARIIKFTINAVPMDLEVDSEQILFNDDYAVKSTLRFIVHQRQGVAGNKQFTPLILNSNKGIIITKLNGTILSVSESFTRLTGFVPQDVIGNNPRIWQSQSYTPVFYEKMWRSLLTKGFWQGELWNKRQDGSHYLMKVNIYSIGNADGQLVYYMAVYTDLTEVEKLAQRLKENEEQYRFIAENSSDMIGRLSPEGDILYISPACQLILGYKPKEMIGTNIFNNLHPEDYKTLLEEYGDPEFFSGIATISYRVRHKNGQYIWAETTIRSVNDQSGNHSGVMFATRDVTARTKIETQLRESNMLLRKISSLDGLTEIYNRRAFDKFLETEWSFARKQDSHISLILLDIDYFKKFNDKYGHIEGDECLKIVARTLDTFFQEKGYFAARFGGEEFAVILPNTNSTKAYQLAESFRSEIQSLQLRNCDSKVSDFVTVSIGLSCLAPLQETEMKKILYEADRALYKAKQNGRNRTEIYKDH